MGSPGLFLALPLLSTCLQTAWLNNVLLLRAFPPRLTPCPLSCNCSQQAPTAPHREERSPEIQHCKFGDFLKAFRVGYQNTNLSRCWPQAPSVSQTGAPMVVVFLVCPPQELQEGANEGHDAGRVPKRRLLSHAAMTRLVTLQLNGQKRRPYPLVAAKRIALRNCLATSQ
jgi:hypothetical protein